jgi:hypothetical protein
VFAWWETRAPQPLLPPRVVLDRNRGGAYLSILIAGSGMFGMFLFLTYYLQQTVGYSPVVTGMAWLTRIGVHSSYASAILPPLLVNGTGLGLVIAPSINTGTFGVALSDAGVASASVNTGQQLAGSIGTALLNAVAASATAGSLTARVSAGLLASGKPSPALTGPALVHGYTTAFWYAAGIFACGAVIAGALFRRGPLHRQDALRRLTRTPETAEVPSA